MRVLVAVFVFVLGTSLAAAQSEQAPAMKNPNHQFQADDLDVGLWLKRFENPKRDVIAHRKGVLSALQFRPGQTVADIGAGTGAYMEGVSKLVGTTGRYYAVDIAPNFLAYMRGRAEKAGIRNVTLVLGRDDSATLPASSMDAVFVVDTYHHFHPHEPMLASLYDALKPGGALIIVDFDRIEGVSRDWIIKHIRADKNTFKAEIQAAGFEFVEEVSDTGLTENFFFRFRKP